MRWLQPLHPATFLIHQNGCITPAYSFPKSRCEYPDLFRRFDVAREQDQSPRVFLLEKVDFGTCQGRSGTPGYKGFGH
jgi:hypothetical protein